MEAKYLLILTVVVLAVFFVYSSFFKPTKPDKYFACDLVEPGIENISCQKAIDIVLEKYPGRVFAVNRDTIDMPQSPTTTEKKEVWSVHVSLDKVTEQSNQKTTRLRVDIDRTNGFIHMLTPLELVQ